MLAMPSVIALLERPRPDFSRSSQDFLGGLMSATAVLDCADQMVVAASRDAAADERTRCEIGGNPHRREIRVMSFRTARISSALHQDMGDAADTAIEEAVE